MHSFHLLWSRIRLAIVRVLYPNTSVMIGWSMSGADTKPMAKAHHPTVVLVDVHVSDVKDRVAIYCPGDSGLEIS